MKTVNFISKSFLTIYFLISLWSIIVYPNDKRIRHANINTAMQDIKIEKVGKLFQYPELIISMPEVKLVESDQTPIPKSSRYKHNAQTLITSGLYPEFIEAHDGFVISPSQSAKWKTPQHTEFIKFHITTSEFGELLVKTPQKTYTIKIQPTPPPPHPFIFKHVLRYLFPDRNYAKWQDITIPTTANAEVEVHCLTRSSSCAISEPHHYKYTEKERKNWIIILIDTLRHDGISEKSTPNLYKLATSSIQYQHTISPSNMTSPAVNSILSCQTPHQIPKIAYTYGAQQNDKEEFYQRQQPSFPKILQQQSIQTTMIGNLSVISDIIGLNVNHGFDSQIAIERDGYDTPKITREANKWLSQHQSESFFLYLHYHAPHAPYKAPLSFIAKAYESPKDLSSTANILKWLYRAELMYTDEYIGYILETLKELNLQDNTGIIVTADHGDHHSSHNFVGNQAGPNTQGSYFDHGATLLNDEVQVPFIIYQPHQQPKKHQQWISNLSIGPFILNQFDIPTPDYCFYQNIDDEKEVLPISGFRKQAILFQGRYKYIRSKEVTKKRMTGINSFTLNKRSVLIPEQLFDLEQSPQEETRSYSKTLLKKLRQYYTDTFKISTFYQINFQSPHDGSLIIRSNILPNNDQDKKKFKLVDDHYLLQQHTRNISLKFNSQPTITVYFNDQNIPIYTTSSQLPLNTPPVELTPVAPIRSNQIQAWITKEEAQTRSTKISAKNIKIERMLKQWGYLQE